MNFSAFGSSIDVVQGYSLEYDYFIAIGAPMHSDRRGSVSVYHFSSPSKKSMDIQMEDVGSGFDGDKEG